MEFGLRDPGDVPAGPGQAAPSGVEGAVRSPSHGSFD